MSMNSVAQKLVALLMLCLIILFSVSGFDPSPEMSLSSPSSPTAAPVTDVTPAAITTYTPEPTPEPTPRPTPEPRPAGGLREDGTFDEDVLFIGDSITYDFVDRYLIPNGYIGDASYMAIAGMPLKLFFSRDMVLGSKHSINSGCVYSEDFKDLCYSEAIAAAEGRFRSFYMLLGSNLSGQSPTAMYIETLDYILEYNPDAVIYIQTIPNSSSETVDSELVNANIRAAVEHYADNGDTRVQLLDTNSVWDSQSLLGDGIHISDYGQEVWYSFILSSMTQSTD